MIGGRRPIKGRKLGDRRVRVDRPHSAYFRYTGPGSSRPSGRRASRPRRLGRTVASVKRVLFGRALSNEEEAYERLPKKLALPIFSSDAISSSAYATEEILRILVIGGASAIFFSIPVAIAIAALLAIVSTSYRQVCRAYPSGGGAYVVARENISQLAGLVAAAALLIDYVMTVAVSTASAVAQVYSVVPELYDLRIEIALVSIALITIANLRGLREAGLVFASPTYIFVGLALLMIVAGGPPGHHGRGDLRRPAAGRRPRRHHRADGDRPRPAPAPLVRRRLGRAHRRRGDRQRRPRIQAAGGEERREHDDDDGDPPRRPLHRHHGHRGRVPHPARRRRAARRSSRRSPPRSSATDRSSSSCSRRRRRSSCSSR